MDLRNCQKIQNISAMEKCRVPYMDAQRAYENDYEPCPKIGGSYNQCTNSHFVSNIDRYTKYNNQYYVEITPPDLYVSRKCFYDNYNPNIRIPIRRGNPINMRVNMYYANYPNPNPKLYRNGAVSY